MEIVELRQRDNIDRNSKAGKAYMQFKKLIGELGKRELPDNIIVYLNGEINNLNSSPDDEDRLKKIIDKTKDKVIRKIEKELKLVPKNYYRNLWLALGMAAFGIPIGVALGISLGNIAFLGIGLPLGIGVGLAMGEGLDKKAKDEGRQIDIE